MFEGLRRDYAAIVADPPWSFATWSEKGKDRSAENHYGVLSLADITALPVAELAGPDCCLFLWATDPLLPQALEVGRAWGFRYATVAFYWIKTGAQSVLWQSDQNFPLGMGYWTRANPEQCLLLTRGRPQRLSRKERKLIVAPRREHSRKPDETFERIERLVDGPRLELFARERRSGWDCFGDEVDKFREAAV
jgi:N6-adenosine-specific RNA methylase IME4